MPSKPTSADRRARLAVAALFWTNGSLVANLVPRYPEIKAALDLQNAVYGLAVAAAPLGAIVAGLAAATLIRRFGSARVAVGGTLLSALAVLAAGLAPSVGLFAAALFAGGAIDAITDVGQNAQGLRVQRRYRRSVLNSLHAIWSIGAVTGGLMATAAIALDLPLAIHLGISAALFGTVALVALPFCLPGRTDIEQIHPDVEGIRGPVTRQGHGTIATVITALVLIAIAGAIVEDAGSTWATLYLSDSLDAPAALAPAGYLALLGAQFVGRLFGDRLVDRFGQRAVARAGGFLTAGGMGLALAFPSIPGTILGFAAAGFGVATLVPAAMHEADELPGLRRGTGLTVVSWLMRLGSLLSPPLVGLVADTAGLRFGLMVVPAAALVVIALAGVLSTKTRRTRP